MSWVVQDHEVTLFTLLFRIRFSISILVSPSSKKKKKVGYWFLLVGWSLRLVVDCENPSNDDTQGVIG